MVNTHMSRGKMPTLPGDGGQAVINDDDDDEDEEEEVMQDYKDDFLDREFNMFNEINRAKKEGEGTKKNILEWSGQDVLNDFDPMVASDAVIKLKAIRVWPHGWLGVLKYL